MFVCRTEGESSLVGMERLEEDFLPIKYTNATLEKRYVQLSFLSLGDHSGYPQSTKITFDQKRGIRL